METRRILALGIAVIGVGTTALTQVASVKQLMLDFIQPASNDLLLSINRGGPKDDTDWASIRRSALALAESANLLAIPGRARDQGDWIKDAKMLADAGTAAYKAAQAKDASALAAVSDSLDASCTACHKKYRPDVFPVQRGSQ
jgi:cytochrome c553